MALNLLSLELCVVLGRTGLVLLKFRKIGLFGKKKRKKCSAYRHVDGLLLPVT